MKHRNYYTIIVTLFAVVVVLLFPKIIFAYTPGAFVTTWQTNTFNNPTSTQITIPTHPGDTYNYNVDWGDSNTDSNVTGDITHTYASVGTYTVSITGTFPRIYFNNVQDNAQKILSIAQWGTNQWTSMANAFAGCSHLTVTASDIPDLSIVTSTSNMFKQATSFNQDISTWDVSHVQDMSGMFNTASNFNQDIHLWNVSNVTNMSNMFYGTTFNRDISSWDVSHVTNMSGMFSQNAVFNQDIHLWNVSHVTNMSSMFAGCDTFNNGGQPVLDLSGRKWDTSSVTTMAGMFSYALAFNQDISSWDVSNVTSMSLMFLHASVFNRPLNLWNTHKVTTMAGMFGEAPAFNQDISSWDVSQVQDMSGMFDSATAFDQPLNAWHTTALTNTNLMFSGASAFNQPLSQWYTGNLSNIAAMFQNAVAFNQDISGWDVSNVIRMNSVFDGDTAFNQNLGAWRILQIGTVIDLSGNKGDMSNIFRNTSLSLKNYDAILAAWSAETLQSGVTLGAGSTHYCMSGSQRGILTSAPNNWTITDGGSQCFTLAYTANTGGSITGTATQHVGLGEDGTLVTAVPASGYSFASWSDNVTQATRTDTNVSGNIAVTASFTANPVVVVTPSGGGHTVGECATGTHLVNIGSTWQCVPDTTPTVTPTPVVSTSPTPTTSTTTTVTPIDTNNNPGTVNLGESCDGDTLVDTAHTGANFLACVKILQTTLNTILGSKLATPLLVDGIYGPKTTDAIKLFQTQAKLAVDGAVGQTTSDALNTSAGTTLGTTFMSSVKALQSAFKTILGLKIPSGLTTNGVFGAHTIHTVKVFQDQVKLIVDGRFGPMTSGVLDSGK